MIILKITMMRINWQRQSEDSLVSMWNFPTLQKGSPQHNLNLLPPFIRRTVNLKSILHALSICSSLCTYVYACSSMSQWEWNVNFFNNIYRTYLYTHWRCLNLFPFFISPSPSLYFPSLHHFAIRFLPPLKREMKFLIGVYSSVY